MSTVKWRNPLDIYISVMLFIVNKCMPQYSEHHIINKIKIQYNPMFCLSSFFAKFVNSLSPQKKQVTRHSLKAITLFATMFDNQLYFVPECSFLIRISSSHLEVKRTPCDVDAYRYIGRIQLTYLYKSCNML